MLMNDKELLGLAMVSGILSEDNDVNIANLKKFETGIGIYVTRYLSTEWNSRLETSIRKCKDKGEQVSDVKVDLCKSFGAFVDQESEKYNTMMNTLNDLKKTFDM